MADVDVEALYRTWRTQLLAYFGRCVAYQDAEDLTQELFLRFLNAQANGTRIIQPRRWLWRAAHNLVVDAYRARAGKPVSAPMHVQLADQLAADPLELAIVWDDRTDVVHHLPALTPGQLEAVVLRHSNGWKHQRVAEAMGIPLDAAKARHQRAVARLRELMVDAG